MYYDSAGTGTKRMPGEITDRQAIVLAALATDTGAEFAPVQVQKLFFLIDENIADEIGGRQFAFEPYDYGPFDKAVYQDLGLLELFGFVKMERFGASAGQRRYVLTPRGIEEGKRVLDGLTPAARDYMLRASEWVRSLSFAQLVGAIYKAYPEMRENSIFQD